MNKNDIFEFNKIYKRVLGIEITLKSNIINALIKTYPNNSFNRLLPYLKTLNHSKYLKNKRDKISDLILSKNSQDVKLRIFIQKAYLIDVLNILTTYKNVYKDKNFKRNFYCSREVDFNMLKQNVSSLNSLRNAIMHFDFNTYINKKRIFLNTLTYWEKILDCQSMRGIHGISLKKLNTKNILVALSNQYSDFLS